MPTPVIELRNVRKAFVAPGGEIVLAGFYTQPIAFAFAPAFMRETRLRVAAEWKRADLLAVKWLIESGQLSLTYDKLVQLSHGLSIDLAELLSSPNAPAPNAALTRRTFTPKGSGKTLTVGDTVYRYMCTEMSAKRMTPMVAEIHARTLEESNGLLAHPGEEFTYVLAGTVELHTEFYEPLLLEAGACVYFDSTMRHTYLAPSGTPGKILCVCSVNTTTAPHGTSRTQEK